jgi:hypothetical protein
LTRVVITTLSAYVPGSTTTVEAFPVEAATATAWEMVAYGLVIEPVPVESLPDGET